MMSSSAAMLLERWGFIYAFSKLYNEAQKVLSLFDQLYIEPTSSSPAASNEALSPLQTTAQKTEHPSNPDLSLCPFYQINIDHETRDLTKENMQAPSPSSFDMAQHKIYMLMAKDCYPRFLRSPAYRDLVCHAKPSSKASKQSRQEKKAWNFPPVSRLRIVCGSTFKGWESMTWHGVGCCIEKLDAGADTDRHDWSCWRECSLHLVYRKTENYLTERGKASLDICVNKDEAWTENKRLTIRWEDGRSCRALFIAIRQTFLLWFAMSLCQSFTLFVSGLLHGLVFNCIYLKIIFVALLWRTEGKCAILFMDF